MTAAAHLSPSPYRFSDGDTIRVGDSESWVRGLRTPGHWALIGGDAGRADKDMRAALVSLSTWRFLPAVPNVNAALPGTSCASREALARVELRPATGGLLYTAALNRLQSFAGNESGVLRGEGVALTRQEIRVALLGTLTRYPRAKITFLRTAGRFYARYRVGNTIQTRIYVLTGAE
ncbi:hypothetical protein [Streptomyces niveus]|uniref:hypothetical protein n=1 Tax=Streptomyces niveus TaxID=193462 RepID=UPI00343303D1